MDYISLHLITYGYLYRLPILVAYDYLWLPIPYAPWFWYIYQHLPEQNHPVM